MFIVLLFLLLLLFRSNTRRVGRDGKNWNREAGTLFTFWAPLEKLNLLRRTGERIVNYYGNHSTCSRNSCTFVLFMLMQWFNFLEWDCSFFEGEFTILLKFSLFFFFFFFVRTAWKGTKSTRRTWKTRCRRSGWETTTGGRMGTSYNCC